MPECSNAGIRICSCLQSSEVGMGEAREETGRDRWRNEHPTDFWTPFVHQDMLGVVIADHECVSA